MKAPHVGFIFLVLFAMYFVISGIYGYALALLEAKISDSPSTVEIQEEDTMENLIWE